MPSVSEIFEIPKFYYFESGNDYSGSKGEFAYKITNGEKLCAMTWHGRLCSAKAQIEQQAEFERSEQGFTDLIKWLEDVYSAG